jgi:hypothetical protein
MNVKDLIGKLKTLNQDAEVRMYSKGGFSDVVLTSSCENDNEVVFFDRKTLEPILLELKEK